MTKETLAATLNGREYGDEISDAEKKQAKSDGLVVVFGYSDDNMEFCGAINDEVSCYDGGEAWVDAKGALPDRDAIDDDDELLEYLARKKAAKKITANWCPKGPENYSWTYTTEIPHATFEIVEDGKHYCRGIVFSLKELAKSL